MPFIFAVYAARRTMPNWFGMARRCHAGTVDRVHGSPIPFGIVWSVRAPPEGEQAVVRLEAGLLAALVRLELRQGSFLRARWACRYVCVVSTDS